MIRTLIPLFLLLLPVLACADTEQNKSLVRGFYETAFNQHNPYVSNGKPPFIKYFTQYYKEHPEAQVEIKRMIAEGDLVVVHARSAAHPKDLGRAVIDIFRVTDSKITEHWDVAQDIPEKSANSNTMF